ncbi:MAG: gamma-glutamyl-gamma-aminobutyrate hydrolase family protein [Geodermatophilaceae bacterium]|nr:gamma-glutamyl-gamma-aminobutyrate hydrolase family protein [Geodermatophilaceae bacterium]
MPPPLIGLSTYVGPASWRTWQDVAVSLVPHAYVDHVLAAGGVPLLVPPAAASTPEMLGVLADRLDGLILVGGPDLDPSLYGQHPHPLAQEPARDRDAAETALLVTMRQRQRPVLGICRGSQVMAVAAGGALVQHLPDVLGHDGHSPGPSVYGEHDVTIAECSRLHSILGSAARVSSYHHQGLAEFPGYIATARAPDGTVEAIEDPDQPFCVGVLWHPEVGTDPRLFQALIAAAAAITERP